MGTDGLLHFLVCYTIMLTLAPFIGWWALIPVIVAALAKEAYDLFIQKDNDKDAVIHDLICDAVGLMLASVVMAVYLTTNMR